MEPSHGQRDEAEVPTGDLLRRSCLLMDRMDALLIEIEAAEQRGERLKFSAEEKMQIEAALDKARRLGLLQGSGLSAKSCTATDAKRRRPLPHDFG